MLREKAEVVGINSVYYGKVAWLFKLRPNLLFYAPFHIIEGLRRLMVDVLKWRSLSKR